VQNLVNLLTFPVRVLVAVSCLHSNPRTHALQSSCSAGMEQDLHLSRGMAHRYVLLICWDFIPVVYLYREPFSR